MKKKVVERKETGVNKNKDEMKKKQILENIVKNIVKKKPQKKGVPLVVKFSWNK